MADPIDRGGSSVALVPAGYNFGSQVVDAQLVPTGTVRSVDPRRPRQRAARQVRQGSQRKGGRPKKNSLRGVFSRVRKRLTGRRFGKRASTKTEVGTTARRKKYTYLTLGTVTIACVFGISSAFATDLAIQKYITKTPAVRLAVHAGFAIVFWWIGGTALVSPMVGEILKLMAMTHLVSGVLIVGTDMANAQAAAATGSATG